MTLNKLKSVLSLLIALTLPFSASPAFSGSAGIAAENAEERINYSGKLRMLSQRIPAAACHLNEAIAPDTSRAILENSIAEFEQIITALEFGDTALNIQAPETQRKSLARIHELRENWAPFKAAAEAIIQGQDTKASLTYVLAENMTLLSNAQLVVEQLSKQYANPNSSSRASLMLIDISGRQRMLTQKMAKETCMIASAFGSTATEEDLAGTMRIFEASLEALRFGMPQVGVLPPPNSDISVGLESVFDDWLNVKPLLGSVLDGHQLDDTSHAIKFERLNVTMASANAVVSLYTEATQ